MRTTENGYERLAPTTEAIDAWRDRSEKGEDGVTLAWCHDMYGVDIRTRSGSWRCVTRRTDFYDDYLQRSEAGYWTIRGEGSSNGGRETWIKASDIAEARGWMVEGYEKKQRAAA